MLPELTEIEAASVTVNVAELTEKFPTSIFKIPLSATVNVDTEMLSFPVPLVANTLKIP